MCPIPVSSNFFLFSCENKIPICVYGREEKFRYVKSNHKRCVCTCVCMSVSLILTVLILGLLHGIKTF